MQKFIPDLLTEGDKMYFSVIEGYIEPRCGWYNIPFKAFRTSKEIFAIVVSLLRKYDIYICGVVDFDGECPDCFNKVKSPGYCFHTLDTVKLNKCREIVRKYIGKDSDIVSFGEYNRDAQLRYNIDKMLYRRESVSGYLVCMTMSVDGKYLLFRESDKQF